VISNMPNICTVNVDVTLCEIAGFDPDRSGLVEGLTWVRSTAETASRLSTAWIGQGERTTIESETKDNFLWGDFIPP
jgi:hypothetical protein